MKLILLLFSLLFVLHNSNAQSNLYKAGFYLVANLDSCNMSEEYFSLEYLSEKFIFKIEPDISISDFDTLATYVMNYNGEPIYSLNIKLNDNATKYFEKLTTNNIGGKIAFIANNKIVIVPTVNGAIPSGLITIQESDSMIKELELYLLGEMNNQ